MRRIRRKLCGIISKTLSMARRIICEVPPLDCEPVSQLVREQHIVPRPCVPVVDSHTHLTMGRYRLGKMSNIKPKIDWDHKQLFEMLDFVGVEKVVDLTPFYGEKLKAVLDFHSPYKERIAVFGTVDFTTVDSKDFFKIVKKNIVDGYKNGMKGLKIFKELGLHYRDSNGRIIMPNDKRLRVIWETCAELSIPVLIHLADPPAFFQLLDSKNEAFDVLLMRPEFHYYGKGLPEYDEIIEAGEELIADNPNTTFILAHVGNMATDLSRVDKILSKYQNVYVDISVAISELGRQPYTSRDFFIKHQEKILFGTDMIRPTVRMHPFYYRFLETNDEYFPYAPQEQLHGRSWMIYGIGLEAHVLKKVYRDNILKLVRFS